MVKVVIPYQPRPWQVEQHRNLSRFTTLVIHRRAGKTVFAVNELIKRALDNTKKRPQVAYIAPTYGQAKRVSWELFKEYVAPIPGVKINESELRIDLPNGGRILVLGAENPDSLRGLYLDYAVLDEVADMPANLWSEVIRPALSDREGGALFIGTPKGKNFFHTLYMRGMLNQKGWVSSLLKWNDTNALKEEEIEALRKELTEEEFEQEMECSFTAAIRGAFFGKQISRAESEKRITTVRWDEDYPVYVAWDIGLDGIALWYAQIVGGECRIIRYEIYEDKDSREVMGFIKNKAYTYGGMILPHDGTKRSVTNKKESTESLLNKGGLRTYITKRLEKTDSIRLGRELLNKCVIDYDNCAAGIESLHQYKMALDADNNPTGREVHNEHSHPGQSWCTLASGLKKFFGTDNNVNTVSDYIRNKKKGNGQKIISKWKVF